MANLEQKIWSSPQLVILARGRAEENVLSLCKYHAGGLGGSYHWCGSGTANANGCNHTACSTSAKS